MYLNAPRRRDSRLITWQRWRTIIITTVSHDKQRFPDKKFIRFFARISHDSPVCVAAWAHHIWYAYRVIWHIIKIMFAVFVLWPSLGVAVHYYYFSLPLFLSGRGCSASSSRIFILMCSFFFVVVVVFFDSFSFLLSSLECIFVSSSYFHQSEFISSSCNSSVTVTDVSMWQSRLCRQSMRMPKWLGLSWAHWRVPYRICNWSDALNYSFNISRCHNVPNGARERGTHQRSRFAALFFFVFTSNRNRSLAMKEAFKLCGRYTPCIDASHTKWSVESRVAYIRYVCGWYISVDRFF